MPGILDALLNPFQSATQASADAYAKGDTGYFPPRPSSPSAAQPSSRTPAPQPRSALPNYSPITDPEGPLARAGWIGALLAQGPSKTEYYKAVDDQKKRQLGEQRGAAFKQLSQLVQSGLSPQKAFLQFVNTPEGMDFIINDPDPNEAVQSFLKMATPDPAAGARADVFGGQSTTGAAAGASPQAGAPSTVDIFGDGGNLNSGADIGMGGGQPSLGAAPQITVNGQTLPPGVDGNKLRQGAARLAAVGDEEGAKLALTMAEQYDKQVQLAKPPTTDELTEYDRYTAQENAAGRTPMSWMDYKVKVANANAMKLNTAPGLEQAQTAARIDVDKDAAKEAAKIATSARQAIPALQEAIKIAGTVPGGYAGALAPYLSRVASSFGMEIPPEWSDAEKLQGITMQLIPLVRQPGQVSNYEQQTYQNAVPSLGQSKEGRKKIAEVLVRQAERAGQIADVYRNNIGAPDLYEKLAALDKPMFTPEEIKEFEAAAKSGPAAKPANTPATAGPAVGAVQDGYRFKGGDPSVKDNWEAVPQGSGNRQGKR